MDINYRNETKTWSIYLVTIVISLYLHEIGHCLPAWFNGFKAIPTPVKEYFTGTIPAGLNRVISLGGIIGTVLFTTVFIGAYLFKSFNYASVLLAGAIVVPGIYSIRFILMGRGHDATEFQEAQSALGFSYSGHFLDWLFLILFLAGIGAWILKSKFEVKTLPRILIGLVVTLVFVIGLQYFNNLLFDPLFQNK
jgi:hypothetical protein